MKAGLMKVCCMKVSRTKTMTNNRQRGFSVVELLVALALGALIVTAAIQMFATNQRTFRLQQALSESQEQGRFGLEYMLRDLRQMGLIRLDEITGLPVGPAGLLTVDTTVGPTLIEASAEGGAAATANDQVSFTFYGFTDCEGDETGLTDSSLIGNTYWVDAGELKCKGSVDVGTTGVTLVDAVDSFQVLYGVDQSADGEVFATRYVRKDLLLADDNIVSIKVGLLVRADGDSTSLGAADSFSVLDKQLAGGTAPLVDSRIRRLFTSTVRVRNYDWESI